MINEATADPNPSLFPGDIVTVLDTAGEWTVTNPDHPEQSHIEARSLVDGSLVTADRRTVFLVRRAVSGDPR